MVGEAGLSPEYFHNTLTYYEANDFLAGYYRRHRHVYEAARMIHGCVGGLFAKNYHLPKFPWDKKYIQSDEEMTKDELDALIARGRKRAKEMNRLE